MDLVLKAVECTSSDNQKDIAISLLADIVGTALNEYQQQIGASYTEQAD